MRALRIAAVLIGAATPVPAQQPAPPGAAACSGCHGTRAATVIPSLQGYGFSGPTRERGWTIARIARAWLTLMRRLGYERFGAAGNDWGSTISPEVGRIAPEAVVGVHVTQIWTDTDEPIEEPEARLAAAGAGLSGPASG